MGINNHFAVFLCDFRVEGSASDGHFVLGARQRPLPPPQRCMLINLS